MHLAYTQRNLLSYRIPETSSRRRCSLSCSLSFPFQVGVEILHVASSGVDLSRDGVGKYGDASEVEEVADGGMYHGAFLFCLNDRVFGTGYPKVSCAEYPQVVRTATVPNRPSRRPLPTSTVPWHGRR